MVPDPRYTVLGLEYFCFDSDSMWSSPDADLVALGTRELAKLGLSKQAQVVDGTVVRQRAAYPVYDGDYRRAVDVIREFIEREMPNLQLVGRNGMHKYNNQDHAMMTGLMAARNIMGASYDLWRVNSDAQYLEEESGAETLAARALELREKYQFPFVAAYNRCVLGRARAELGRATEGVELMPQGIAGLLEVGFRLGMAIHTASLAAALGREGATVDALAMVEQALQANPGQLAPRPEMLTLRGELRLEQGQTELAEADFREAIALAQKMDAKASELQATMSLARLLDRTGRREEARAMLAEIYGWFTEGFDTADLKDAKALLDQLNA